LKKTNTNLKQTAQGFNPLHLTTYKTTIYVLDNWQRQN